MVTTFNRNVSLLKASLIFIGFSIGIVIILTLDYWKDNSHTYSMVFCSYYLFILYALWIIGNKRIQPYLLFYLTFGLFIGGRFWANVLGYDGDIWSPTIFYSYSVSHDCRVELLQQVIGFMCFSLVGYSLSKIHSRKESHCFDFHLSRVSIESIRLILKRFYIFFLIYIIFTNVSKLLSSLDGGYLSLYAGKQSSKYVSGGSIIDALLSVFLGIAMGYGNMKCRRNYLILMVITSFFMIIIGARSHFGAMLLVLLWLYAQYHKVNLKQTLLLCLGCMTSLLFIFFTMSLRTSSSDPQFIDSWNIFLTFIYDQGSSLMVFDVSKMIDSYPILPYFTRFLPGITGLISLLTGNSYYPYETSFADYMCYQLNPQLFLSGQGLGWSLLSDIYLFSFRSFFLFLILSMGWGFLIGKLEYWAEYSTFFKSYMYIIITGLLMVPRSSIAGIFPYIFYLFSTLLIIVFFIQLFQLKNGRHSTSLGRRK